MSLRVKAIKRSPWLMRWFESLIKSLIEPNTPTLLHPIPFLLIFYQLLGQQNITINLLNLCPFPEPKSHVLELYTHSFSSSFIQTAESSQDKTFLSHPIRMHRPHALTCSKAKTCYINYWIWTQEITDPRVIMCFMLTISILITSFSNSALTLLPSLVDFLFTKWWIIVVENKCMWIFAIWACEISSSYSSWESASSTDFYKGDKHLCRWRVECVLSMIQKWTKGFLFHKT